MEQAILRSRGEANEMNEMRGAVWFFGWLLWWFPFSGGFHELAEDCFFGWFGVGCHGEPGCFFGGFRHAAWVGF